LSYDPRAVSLDDWILALHVLSAFAMVGAMVLFWIVIVAMRNVDTVSMTLAYAPVATIGSGVIGAGSLGAFFFGVWLAIAKPEYQLWDGWVIAGLVLWAIAAPVGARGGTEYTKALTRARELQETGQEGSPGELRALNRSPVGLRLHTIASLLALLILADMIWKPGA
jgi:uncharacterized integral membrane protein